MKWEGSKIKSLATDNSITLSKLAEQINVSRQSINDWINGQPPKGTYLMALCDLFNVNPNYFFSNNISNIITVPVHRKRGVAKITKKRQELAIELSKKYVIFFKNKPEANIVPVIRISERTHKNALDIANKIRKLANINSEFAINFKDTFQILNKLGIHVIFQSFPMELKTYAFYTKIFNYRVVFLNISTNIIDAIFALLHESIHAIRDEVIQSDTGYEEEEEKFCDFIAQSIQFPMPYVSMVYDTIADLHPNVQLQKLINFSKKYDHSLFGIYQSMKQIDNNFELNVYPSDTKLRKSKPKFGELLFNFENPTDYINQLIQISPNFMKSIEDQIDILSDRKLGELLNLEDYSDIKNIKSVINTKKLSKINL